MQIFKDLKQFTVSGINQLSFKASIEKMLFDFSKREPSIHDNIECVSYHIPKTAGTSLRLSLDHAYHANSVYGAYRESGAKELSRGDNIWLPNKTKVIHGHFRTHVNHYQYFPNAKHIVWVRDPIERAWSLLGHLLAVKPNTPHFNLLKSRYIDKGILNKVKLFQCIVKDAELSNQFFVYHSYFKQISIDQFNFVGSMHSINKDCARLSDVLGKTLIVENQNRRTNAKDLPTEAKRLEKFFANEYEIVANYLNK